ncbi:competence protein CoiA [Microbacterium sp.]|uniref:competence protein CoiA n=1 Tax=Microbacterium sp. TaxID=51671 RepID=UPI003A940D0F
MAMIALLDGTRVNALDVDEARWGSMRAEYRLGRLTMVCGRRAIPKRSKLGLRFFAHAPGETECGLHESGPETLEHQRAKQILARAAEQAGWKATIECVAPDRSWIADVLLERGGKRVAVEVQWSPQNEEDFARRTMRYREAGVGCAWFLGPANHRRNVARSYQILGDVDFMTMSLPGQLGAAPAVLPLADAALPVFRGDVRSVVELRAERLVIEYFMRRCWRGACGKWFARWYVVGVEAVSRCGRYVRIDVEEAATELWRPHATGRVEQVLQREIRDKLREHMAAAVIYEWRTTGPMPDGYVGAICPHCRTVQGDGLTVDGGERQVTIPWTGTFPWSPGFLSTQKHQCIDVGHGRCQPVAAGVGPRYPPDDLYVRVMSRTEIAR